MKDFYSPKEISQILNVSVITVYRWLNQHKIKFDKFKGQYRISKTSLEYLQANYRNQHADAKSSRQVCQELNISLPTLYNITNHHSIEHHNILRQNYSYFSPHAVEQIKDIVTKQHKRGSGPNGVFRPSLPANTDHMYDEKIDYSPFSVCALFTPVINNTTMNRWIKLNIIDYSVDKNHQVFFTPAQLKQLQAKYKRYPDIKLHKRSACLKIVGVSNMKFYHLVKQYQIQPYVILGDRNKYFDDEQLAFLQQHAKKKVQHAEP